MQYYEQEEEMRVLAQVLGRTKLLNTYLTESLCRCWSGEPIRVKQGLLFTGSHRLLISGFSAVGPSLLVVDNGILYRLFTLPNFFLCMYY